MRSLRLVRFLLLLLALAPIASAQSYTGVVVFGDSLSDVGNDLHLFHAKYLGTVDVPSPAFRYTSGRFTDGTDTTPAATLYTGVWIEQLAASLPAHPALTNSLDGGTNYAYGYAETGTGTSNLQIAPSVDADVNNLTQQVNDYLGAHTSVPAGTLVVVWGGANDLIAITASSTPQQIQTIIANGVSNEVALVQRLIAAGATDILVPNLPPLGLVPRFNSNVAESQAATAAAQTFNTGLQTALTSLSSGSAAHIYQLDTFSLFNGIVAGSPGNGILNFTASSQAAAVNPDQYLFWDDLHPTTAGHHLIAAAALALITPAPPVVTTTSVTSSALTANLGSSVTFTATVTATAGAPVGPVTFSDSGTALGSANLTPASATTSTATFATSSLAAGDHTITATYAGGTGFAASTSAAITQTVVAPSLTATLSPTTLTVTRGASGTAQVTLTPAGGFSGTVQVACGTLPAYANCTTDAPLGGSYNFSGSSSPQTATITITTNNSNPPVPAILLLPLAGLGTLAFTRRRHLRSGLLVVITTLGGVGLLTLSGCSDSAKRTPSGTYTVPITVTPSTGAATTLNLSLVVQ